MGWKKAALAQGWQQGVNEMPLGQQDRALWMGSCYIKEIRQVPKLESRPGSRMENAAPLATKGHQGRQGWTSVIS